MAARIFLGASALLWIPYGIYCFLRPESLAEAGVHRIEAGLPAVSPADDVAVREMVKMGLPSKIYAFSRCMVEDVQRAADCGVEGVVMEIPSSHHLIEKGDGARGA